MKSIFAFVVLLSASSAFAHGDSGSGACWFPFSCGKTTMVTCEASGGAKGGYGSANGYDVDVTKRLAQGQCGKDCVVHCTPYAPLAGMPVAP